MEHVVMIGGGYASIFAYRALTNRATVKKIRRGELKITVISDREHHYFHGFTGEVLSGLTPPNAICTPLERIFRDATIEHGTVVSISPFNRSVKWQEANGTTKRETSYTQLLIGCGSMDKFDTVDGLEASSFAIKRPHGLERLMQRIEDQLVEASSTNDEERKRRLLNFAVVGSGFTAVEIATNLSEFLNKKKSVHPVLNTTEAKIVLFAKKDSLLKEWRSNHPRLVRYAERCLKKADVSVREHDRLLNVLPDGIVQSDDQFFPTNVVVPAIGQQIVPVKGVMHLSLTDRNKIQTDAYLNALGYPEIWCAGDVAQVSRPFRSEFCPPNALWAIMQGKRVGKNIRRVLARKNPRPFRFPGLGQAASFGLGKGASVVYGIGLKGWLGYLVRMGFFLYFFPDLGRLFEITWRSRKKPRAHEGERNSPLEA